ncbi:MAG: hypothetical protein JOZ96_19190 [Acidobacteria bacterium]|nr:hypothetical protein [Acidobacteriota bacterium]MBV9927150.1 hypothetical protein [Acidobacteriota bacterium]
MSDYLWDKKGEPERDVARLEAMLGSFAHEPRPLEWPAEAEASEETRATLLPFAPRAWKRFFAPAALAAAAALLVTSLLAANAFLRARVPAGGERAAAQNSPQPPEPSARKDERAAPPEPQRAMLTPPEAGGVKDAPPASVGKVKDEKVEVETLKRVARQRKEVQLAAVTPRRPRDSGAGSAPEAMSAPGVASSLVENARLLTKEQLVYALRLTSAKLKDMRQRAQGESRQ